MDPRVFNRELVLISYLRGLLEHAILSNNTQGGLQKMVLFINGGVTLDALVRGFGTGQTRL